jgi:hypothetical protein
MKNREVGALVLATAALLLAQLAPLRADAAPKPLKVFILAGQSNMDGQANVLTIDFLGEDKEHGDLLKTFKPDGKTLVIRDDVWVAHRGVYGNLAPGYGGRKSDDKLGNNIGPEYAFGYFMSPCGIESLRIVSPPHEGALRAGKNISVALKGGVSGLLGQGHRHARDAKQRPGVG